MRRAIYGLLLTMTVSVPATAQTIEIGDIKFRLLGRVQAQFNTTSVDEVELIAAGATPSPIPASTFETRRIRLGAEAEYQDWLTGKIETELAMARLQLRDAYVNMEFDPRFQVRLGQFKKPFSLLQLTSSATWPVIERALRIRGLADALAVQDAAAGGAAVLQEFDGDLVIGEEQALLDVFLYQNYDLGATVHGRLGAFGYTIGAFNGNGSDRPADTDDKSYAGRFTYTLPFELPMTFGAAFSHREFRVSTTPTLATRGGTAFEADVEIGAFRRHGLHVLAEVTLGDNLQQPDDEFLAAQGVVAWFQPLNGGKIEGIELAARASYGDPRRDVELDEGLLLTPGVNVYFSGRNRLMLNWDVFLTDDRFEQQNALRAQAQVYF